MQIKVTLEIQKNYRGLWSYRKPDGAWTDFVYGSEIDAIKDAYEHQAAEMEAAEDFQQAQETEEA